MLANPDAVTQLRALVEDADPPALRTETGEALQALDQARSNLDVVLAILGDWHGRTIRNIPLIAKLELYATLQIIRQQGFLPKLALVNLVARP